MAIPIEQTVQYGQHQQRQQGGGQNPADHHGRQRSLYLGAGAGVERHRQEAQACHQCNHNNRAQPTLEVGATNASEEHIGQDNGSTIAKLKLASNRATGKGRRMLAEAKEKINELVGEVLEG